MDPTTLEFPRLEESVLNMQNLKYLLLLKSVAQNPLLTICHILKLKNEHNMELTSDFCLLFIQVLLLLISITSNKK